ncbi:hypothetical protein SAMN04488691_11410 [Haloferax larsenii]|uniref:Uncharacterized protein n=1 Tax=Haloferax larsenii TaxID=302484 RepID=A0A1H7URT7_HALLR|nr:hypothetical protein SAMN04488691_11410 [Haloferax larsenii]
MTLDPLSNLLTIRRVHTESCLKRLVYFSSINMPVFVCQDVSKPNRSDKSVHCLLVNNTLSTQDTNCPFRRTTSMSEITCGNMLSKVRACLNRVFEHPLNSTLFRRTLQELVTRQRLLFVFQFAVILFDLFKLD